MQVATKFTIGFGLAYLALFALLVVSYLFTGKDELIILSILGLPLSIVLMALPTSTLPLLVQVSLMGILGVVQYITLGYLVGLLAQGLMKTASAALRKLKSA